MISPIPRFVVAGTGGDSGKTLITLALIAQLRRRGRRVVSFKKGPDYIDAAWLSWAVQGPAHNLDTYLMGPDGVVQSFGENALLGDISVIEGNRGLLDGMDAVGTHSTAALAEAIRAPVLVVLPARKVTRTVAAWVAGFQKLAPETDIRGVVLNQVAGQRHARVATQSIEALGVPVLGVVPPLGGEGLLPDRHLGLVTPEEHGKLAGMRDRLADIADEFLDVDRILEFAGQAEPLDVPAERSRSELSERVRIGVFRDSAFTFYYPDNLKALEQEGAEIVNVSALGDDALPSLDGLVIGGGFPETHAHLLSQNVRLRESVKRAADDGLPIYAECGGLMYLTRALHFQGETYPMAGVLDFEVVMNRRPQGHGYTRAIVDSPNPFFEVGTKLRGHEFHYSSVAAEPSSYATAYAVERGSGCGQGRDAATCKNVLAAYIHLHARGCPEWAAGVVRAAFRHRSERAISRA